MFAVSYEEVSRDLLRALRGSRSQVGFSRRLRYKSNVSYLWEAGRSWPTAAVALWAAERVKIDVAGAIRAFYRAPPPWLEQSPPTAPEGIARMLDDLRGNATIQDLAARCQRSRFAVARWLKGLAEPRLPDFLRMIEATSSRLLDFLACLVDPDRLPSVRIAWRQLQAARTMVARLPWSPAVLLTLQVDAYRALPAHQPGWIAARLGLPPEVEDECLEVLAATGQIRRVDRRWEVVRVQTIDTRNDPEAGRKLKAWWSEVGVNRVRRGAPGVFSYNVFSVSRADLERLEEMHRAYFRAMRAVIAASEPAERVVVANLHLFALDDGTPPSG